MDLREWETVNETDQARRGNTIDVVIVEEVMEMKISNDEIRPV